MSTVSAPPLALDTYREWITVGFTVIRVCIPFSNHGQEQGHCNRLQ